MIVDPRVRQNQNIFLSPADIQIEKPFDVMLLTKQPYKDKTVEVVDRYKTFQFPDPNSPLNERVYMRQYLRTSDFKLFYQGEPYNIFDYFGDVGGLLSIVMFVFGSFVTGIARHLYHSSFIEETYQVQKYTQDKDEYYKSEFGSNKGKLTKIIDTESEERDEFCLDKKSAQSNLN